EKFYADRYPARWDRIERLVRFISTDLMTPVQGGSQSSTNGDHVRGYRVPIEPYSITEESDLESKQSKMHGIICSTPTTVQKQRIETTCSPSMTYCKTMSTRYTCIA